MKYLDPIADQTRWSRRCSGTGSSAWGGVLSERRYFLLVLEAGSPGWGQGAARPLRTLFPWDSSLWPRRAEGQPCLQASHIGALIPLTRVLPGDLVTPEVPLLLPPPGGSDHRRQQSDSLAPWCYF